MMIKPRINTILIVGGGIGGLALAGFLQRGDDLRVDLIERAEAWRPVGAGIGLGSNAVRLLGELGIADRICRSGQVLRAGVIADADARTLATISLEKIAAKAGAPSVALHRAALHDALLGAIDTARVTVRLGTTIRALANTPDGVDVETSDGVRRRYDLVIGADGINSQVRDLAVGHATPRYSGYTCWRFLLDLDFPFDREVGLEMWGRGKRFGIVPIGGNRIYGFALENAPRRDRSLDAITIDRFRESYARFGGPAPAVLRLLTDRSQLIRNDIEDIAIPRWRRGRVLLIGDAAHAMTPNMGQGAAMAIEDAYMLAGLLDRPRDPDAMLDEFVRRRRPRVDGIQRRSLMLGRLAQIESPSLCCLRDTFLRLTPDAAHMKGTERMVVERVRGYGSLSN